MQAIETKYKGFRFRSRTEARWAVFFDSLNVKWQYETEGYRFKSGDMYLPDFWLPELQVWFEVKGDESGSGDERTKAEQLHNESTFPVVIAWGTPGEHSLSVFCTDSTDSSSGVLWWDKSQWTEIDGALRITTIDNGKHHYFRSNYEPTESIVGGDWRWSPRILKALNAAKAARFEHGEAG